MSPTRAGGKRYHGTCSFSGFKFVFTMLKRRSIFGRTSGLGKDVERMSTSHPARFSSPCCSAPHVTILQEEEKEKKSKKV